MIEIIPIQNENDAYLCFRKIWMVAFDSLGNAGSFEKDLAG